MGIYYKNYELMICIKCHKYLDFILDTYQSVLRNTDPEKTLITFAVDINNEDLSCELIKIFGSDKVYTSPYRCGWGGGLFNLILASTKYFLDRFSFNHLVTMDYDSLFLTNDVDKKILQKIEPGIGVLGRTYPMNTGLIDSVNKCLIPTMSKHGEINIDYTTNRKINYTLGCFVVFTQDYLKMLETFGFFNDEWINGKNKIRVREDMFMPMLAESVGLKVVGINDIANCAVVNKKPFGQENDGICIFHPTKLFAHIRDRANDIEVRNYYRKIRGEEPLK